MSDDKNDGKFEQFLRDTAAGYHAPPELSRADLDDMWHGIEPRLPVPMAARRTRWLSTPMIASLAAAVLIGIAIGRMTARGGATAQVADARRTVDSLAVPTPYQVTTSQYLGQAAALLVALPVESRQRRADDQYLGRAHDLLLTTRLLLDSPAAGDPRLRSLLEDLELVLAQVARLQVEDRAAELDLIRQALEERDVLPRLRNAVANISADD